MMTAIKNITFNLLMICLLFSYRKVLLWTDGTIRTENQRNGFLLNTENVSL